MSTYAPMKTLSLPLLVALCAVPCFGQDRTALLIANFDYGEHQLAAPRTAATAVGKSLEALGFHVAIKENLDARGLREAVDAFASDSITGGVAVLYFAGLAGQYPIGGSEDRWGNYLQGAGQPRDRNRPERDGLTLEDLLKILEEKQQARHTLLILDCCAGNPFQDLSRPPGLASVAAASLEQNMLLCMAAPPGTVVAEGATEDSAFAAAWARRMPQLRQSLGKTLEAVRHDARKQSDASPWWIAGGEGATRLALDDRRTFLHSEQPRDGNKPGQEWINGIGMVFCWCPPGSFPMGEPDPRAPDSSDAKPTPVTLSRGFWMGKYEVTQREYKIVRSRDCVNPLTRHNNAPLHNVELGNADVFCRMLTERERKAGRLPDGWEYLLPTEAEWEYACRAGSTVRYAFGNDPSHLARYGNFADAALLADDSSMQFADGRWNDGVGKALALVGSYQPNAWGLHDMHGNVWEWCRDRYGPALPGGVDPLSEERTDRQVIRGGAWCSMPHYCGSAFRNNAFGGDRRDFLGFRVVLKKTR